MPKIKTTKNTRKKSIDKTGIDSTSRQQRLPDALRPKMSGFSIMDQPLSFIEDTKAGILKSVSRKKNRPVDFKTLEEIRRDLVPVRDFMFQYLIDSYGVPQASIVDIIGAPHTGKTGLLHWLMGGFMRFGSPCYMQSTEAKPYTADWGMRFLSSDPQESLAMSERLLVEPVYSLTHSIESLINWVKVQRGKGDAGQVSVCVPLSVPLVVGIDTWSKLMNPKEEAGRYAYADNMDAKQVKNYKEIGEGSNLGHANFAAGMGRVLPYFLASNNVILILVRHQFEKINMSPGAGFSMSAEVSARYNTTSTGGKSFDQNASLQLIMGRLGQAKNSSGDVIGDQIWCRCHKNSFGTKDRQIVWTLKNKDFHDSASRIEPALNFSEYMGQKFTEERWLGTQANNKRLTCDTLGVTAVTAEDFSTALHLNSEVMLDLGRKLGISGYIDIVDQVRKQIEASHDIAKTDTHDDPVNA